MVDHSARDRDPLRLTLATEAEIEAARENVARMLDRAIEYLVEGGEPNCPIHFALLHPDGPTAGLDLMLERRRKEMSDARLAH
jgi:hypothetical protein